LTIEGQQLRPQSRFTAPGSSLLIVAWPRADAFPNPLFAPVTHGRPSSQRHGQPILQRLDNSFSGFDWVKSIPYCPTMLRSSLPSETCTRPRATESLIIDLRDKLHHISWATLAFGKIIPSWDHRGPRYPRDFCQPDFN
jgi:hypothetical protein